MSLTTFADELAQKQDTTGVVDVEIVDGKLLIEHDSSAPPVAIAGEHDVETAGTLPPEQAEQAGAAPGNKITAFVEA